MKLGSILVCLLTWVSLNSVQAQNDLASPTSSKAKSRFYISDLYIQTGIMFQEQASLSLNDYRKIAPNSPRLQNDFSSFGSNNYRQRSGNPLFSMLLGIDFRDKPNWQLRVGFATMQNDASSITYTKATRKSYDTLTSAQTGREIYIDSVDSQYYNMDYSRQQMRLEASLIYRTNPEKRWGFHAGIGASLILNINNTTQINYYRSKYTEISAASQEFYQYSRQGFSAESSPELYRHKNSIGFGLFAPIGVDFRIGKVHHFWSRIHLLYEIRPTLTHDKVGEVSNLSINNTQHNLGLRLHLAK